MNLHSRLIAIGCLSVILQIALLLGFYAYFLHPKIATLEKSSVERNLHRGVEVLQHEQLHLERLARLIARAPIAKKLMTQPLSSETLTTANLVSMMQSLELNVVSVLNPQHQVIWEHLYDLSSELAYPEQAILSQLWQQQPSFFEHTTVFGLHGGILKTSLGPMWIVSAPIIEQDDIKGTLVIGKLISQEVIALIQKMTYTDLQLFPFAGATLKPKQQQTIDALLRANSDFTTEKSGHLMRGFMVLQDIKRQPSLLLSDSQPRTLTRAIEVSYLELAAGLLGLQCLFLFALFLLVHQSFIKPIQSLITKINEISEPSKGLHKQMDPRLEVGLLEDAVAYYIERQHSATTQETLLAYREGEAQAITHLHQDLRDNLTPLISGLEVTEKKLGDLPINELEWIIATCKARTISADELDDLVQELHRINLKLRHYQKETRLLLYELYTKISRNVAPSNKGRRSS